LDYLQEVKFKTIFLLPMSSKFQMQKNQYPKVSVIMSVYNGERHLPESIESILNQTFKDFEFVIIDDGSTDKAPEILKEYAKKDKRVKIITNKENIGLTKSLNKGIKIAKGEYIARIDANDISLPERLEKQLDFMENHPEVGLVSAYTQFIDEGGKLLSQINQPKETITPRRLFFDSQITHSSMMIKKGTLDKVGGYDERFFYSQDCDLAFRIIKLAKIGAIPEILVLWRSQKGSISTKKRWSQVKFEVIACSKAINSNLYPAYYYLFLPLFLIKPFIPLSFKNFLRKTLLKII